MPGKRYALPDSYLAKQLPGFAYQAAARQSN
jgi:hypothetical protein